MYKAREQPASQELYPSHVGGREGFTKVLPRFLTRNIAAGWEVRDYTKPGYTKIQDILRLTGCCTTGHMKRKLFFAYGGI